MDVIICNFLEEQLHFLDFKKRLVVKCLRCASRVVDCGGLVGEAHCSWKLYGHSGANLPLQLQVCSVMYFVKLKRTFSRETKL